MTTNNPRAPFSACGIRVTPLCPTCGRIKPWRSVMVAANGWGRDCSGCYADLDWALWVRSLPRRWRKRAPV